MKDKFLFLALFYFVDFTWALTSLEQAIIDELNKRAFAVKTYVAHCKLYNFGKEKDEEAKLIYKGEKVYYERCSPEGCMTRIYDGRYEYTLFPNVVYKSDFKLLMEKYGKLAELILPLDLRRPFQFVDLSSLKYIKIEKVKNTWVLYAYIFEGDETVVNIREKTITKMRVKMWIDSQRGLLYRKEIYNNGKLLFGLEVKEVKFNAKVEDEVFKIHISQPQVYAFYFWDELLRETVLNKEEQDEKGSKKEKVFFSQSRKNTC